MINEVHTSCNDCIFAIRKNNKEKTQTGCKIGKLDFYERAGAEVIEVYDDFGKEFFVINNKVCIGKRTKEWGKEYPPHEWEEIVKKQSKIRYQILVILDEKHSLKELNKTLKSIENQDNVPTIVTIINSSYAIDTDTMIKNMNTHDKLNWRVQAIVMSDQTIRQKIDLVIDATYSRRFAIYATFNAGYVIPQEFSSELESALQERMLQFAVAVPSSGINGMMVSSILHKKHGGNAFYIPLEEKIKEFEENGEDYIIKSELVCPCLKR